MSFRFRRSLRLVPGVRLNFSRSGVSASFGVRGASVTLGKSGTHLNLGIPGTGLSYRTRLDRPAGTRPSITPAEQFTPPTPPPSEPGDDAPPLDGLHYTGRREFRSAHPDTLSSVHLKPLAEFLSEIEARRSRIEAALNECRGRTGTAARRVASGRSFPLRMVVSKERVALIDKRRLELSDLSDQLSNMLEGTVIDADFGLSDEARSEYLHLLDSYADLTRSQTIWDVSTSTDINRVATRSAASSAITRTRVGFSTTKIAELDSDFVAMHLSNANGGDLYLYPGILAVRNPRGGFALLDMRDVEIRIESTNFVEDEALPTDAERIGQVWAKSNKDGSADRRFRDNYQIPLMRYGQIALRTKTGLNEVYMVSNWQALSAFQLSLKRYLTSLPRVGSISDVAGAAGVPYDAMPDLDIPSVPSVPSVHTAGSTLKLLAAIAILGLGVSTAIQASRSPVSQKQGLGDTDGTAIVSGQDSTPPPVSTPASETSSGTGPSGGQASPSITTTPAPESTAASDQSTSSLSPEDCKNLQLRLIALGYKPGPADGTLGRRTLQAFNQWRISTKRSPVDRIEDTVYREFMEATK